MAKNQTPCKRLPSTATNAEVRAGHKLKKLTKNAIRRAFRINHPIVPNVKPIYENSARRRKISNGL